MTKHNIAHGPASGPASSSEWDNIPLPMRERRQWCISPATDDDKAPRTITGSNASCTDPNTWADFEPACSAAKARGWKIGYILDADDPFSCIDLDVKQSTPVEDIERFHSIIEQFDSFTEQSRSGKGWHIWVHANIGRGFRREGVEVYSQERFIICTGNVVRSKLIAERQDMLGNMVSQMRESEVAPINLWGDDLPDWIAAAQAAEDTGELGRLFRGDWEGRYPSQSEADLALVTRLIPLTDSPRECWRTFRLSKLGEREKAGRTGYAKSTLAAAFRQHATREVQIEHGRALAANIFGQGEGNSLHYRLYCDRDLEQRPKMQWLVKRIVPNEGVGAIYGDSGTYKSFLTLDMLAHISNGLDWFGQRVRSAPAVYVPFEGQGGIPNRIRAWRLAQAARQDPEFLYSCVPPDSVRANIAVIFEPLNLREQVDRDKLVATLRDNGWAGGVLCIDTLAQASNGIDENTSAMGEMLSVFRELQHELGGVILFVHHSGKDKEKGMRGWSGTYAAMDFVIECRRDGKKKNRDAEFILVKGKDGEDGNRFQFTMQAVQLGYDDDDDPITSLVVAQQEGEIGGSRLDKPDAARDSEDDQFVWDWVKCEHERGEYPSLRSLEGQRQQQMAQERALTQKQLRDAVNRLKAASRIVNSKGMAPSGNKYLVAV